MNDRKNPLPPFRQSLGATIMNAREAVLAPLRSVLKDVPLSEPQWRIMRELADQPSSDPTTLATAAMLHAPSVARIIRDLEVRGLLTREEDPADRRRAIISLSAAGSSLVQDVSQKMALIYADYARRFGADRLARITAELRALSDALRESA
jgi:homoprotocatechuate degradation regulator HpaR